MADLLTQFAVGTITHETLVWWEGQPAWQTLEKTKLVPAPVSEPVQPQAREFHFREQKVNSEFAKWSLFWGIVSVIICNPFFIFTILAIAMGHMARSQIHRHDSYKGGWMALVGMTLGYLTI